MVLYILELKDVRKDTKGVGGKGGNLGEMFNSGLPVPDAFIVTTKAYEKFLEKTKIKKKIFDLLKKTDVNKTEQLQKNTAKIRKIIEKAKIPKDIEEAIIKAYEKLSKKSGKKEEYVAVRSSATAEDIPSIGGDEFVLVKINGIINHIKMKDLFKAHKYSMIEALTMKDGDLKWQKVSEIYKHWIDSTLFKILTRTGRELIVSPNHSLIILDKKTLKPDVIPSIKEIKNKKIKVPTIRKIPANDKFLEYLDLREIFEEKSFAIHENKIKILNKSNNWKIQKGLPWKLKITKNLLYFIGIFLADGTIDTYSNRSVIITNSSKEVQEKVKKFAEKIGINAKCDKKFSIRLHSKVLTEFLIKLTLSSYPKKKGKGNIGRLKKVPNFVFNIEPKLIGEFLKGCFDGDGGVGKESIEFYNKSKELISGIIKLLEIIGIEAYIKRRKDAYKIYIPEREAKKFKDFIGFQIKEKQKKLQKLIQNYKSREKHFDFIEVFEIEKEFFRTHLEKNLPRSLVKVPYCPICGKNLEKTSYYKDKTRYRCVNCKKTFYENDVIQNVELKYKYWDEKGRFKPGIIPWNKGKKKGRFGAKTLSKIAEKYKMENEIQSLFKDIRWEDVVKIEPIKYKGYVYDFVIPETENFAAGLGGIITHNSASFAGQQLTLLNVKGKKNVINAVKKCWASLFTSRATFYRAKRGFEHEKVLIAVPVQKQLGALKKEDYLKGKYKAGVGFTVHPATGEKNKIVIEGSWGQGESVVSGSVTPDTYVIDKKTGKILEKHIAKKDKMRITKLKGGLLEINVPKEMQEKQCLTKEELKQLWKLALKLEKHYKFPQDFEWASENGKVYLVQSRPVTVFYEKGKKEIKVKEKPILEGLSASPGVAIGKVKIVLTPKEAAKKLKKGDILVTKMTSPDWVPFMKIAGGIITSEGGITAHAAIVSRELGIPCIVGANQALKVLRDDMLITLDSRKGLVYEGEINELLEREKALEVSVEEVKKLKTKTKILMNLGEPEEIKRYKELPFEGIGLMRVEFIIASWVGEHPNYLIKKHEERKYINKLAKGIEKVAKEIYPRFVVVRFSDFKTNEYRDLKGGKKYEPEEANPMIGWRGVSRYISPEFEKAFRLECKAIKKVRKKYDNVWVMLPFVRTEWEVERCLKIMEEEDLKRSKKFKVWCMAEVPSTVFLADKFAKLFDGFSIGSNDLTQLILGIDRDSAILANMGYFDERNEAVKRAIKDLIKKAHKQGVSVSICGQAPSVYPEFTEFLVKAGIDSISVNPDVVAKTKKIVYEIENKIKWK